MPDAAVIEAIGALWRRCLGPGEGLAIEPAPVSGNNRVFQVRADGRAAIAKWYCDSSTRDRLDAEWRFLDYAAQAGITCVPAALARDDEARLALHGLCSGRKPHPGEVGAREVDEAIAFFGALNQPGFRTAAAGLPDAAEAAFSADEHFRILDRRIGNLSGIEDAEARALAARMAEFWSALRERLSRRLDPAPLPAEGRCVSPSDFGFHNAIVGEDGKVSFIDFEYGGWDDPAKALCDFTLQPAVPVPAELGRRFVAEASALFPGSAERARILRPLFALKWCCIMLNPFVPRLARPGRFSDPSADPAERKARQLAKARAAFDNILSEE